MPKCKAAAAVAVAAIASVVLVAGVDASTAVMRIPGTTAPLISTRLGNTQRQAQSLSVEEDELPQSSIDELLQSSDDLLQSSPSSEELEDGLCSCSPMAYEFRLNFNARCGDDTALTDNLGVTDSVCFFTKGGTPDDVGGGIGLGRRGVREKNEWKRLLDEAMASLSPSHHDHREERLTQGFDATPTTITSVTLIEFDTNINVINQNSTYFDTVLANGDVISYPSISSQLDTTQPLSDQMELLPEGVMLVLFGVNKDNINVQNTVILGYNLTECNSEPFDNTEGDGAFGWASLESYTPPKVAFCPAVTYSPTLSPSITGRPSNSPMAAQTFSPSTSPTTTASPSNGTIAPTMSPTVLAELPSTTEPTNTIATTTPTTSKPTSTTKPTNQAVMAAAKSAKSNSGKSSKSGGKTSYTTSEMTASENYELSSKSSKNSGTKSSTKSTTTGHPYELFPKSSKEESSFTTFPKSSKTNGGKSSKIGGGTSSSKGGETTTIMTKDPYELFPKSSKKVHTTTITKSAKLFKEAKSMKSWKGGIEDDGTNYAKSSKAVRTNQLSRPEVPIPTIPTASPATTWPNATPSPTSESSVLSNAALSDIAAFPTVTPLETGAGVSMTRSSTVLGEGADVAARTPIRHDRDRLFGRQRV